MAQYPEFGMSTTTHQAGSQYDAGSASIVSIANIVGERIFTSQIHFLMPQKIWTI